VKTLTIRGVDPDLAVKLKQAASEQNKSVNQVVLEIIRKNMGVEKEKKYTREYDDLDHLFGSWDDDQFNLIQKKIDRERTIDRELWDS
jgi:plasmid stability protein